MINKEINGYKVVEFLGKGQFGEVYRAEKNNEVYAIKFIRKDFFYVGIEEERLDREISALRKVQSEYSIKYFEDGDYSENFTNYKYIVMEYVEGKTLRQIRNEDLTPWEEHRAIDLVSDIIKGLKDIHASGIIHRDLKPENIKITSDGKIKILDYGLSKIIDYTSITQTGIPLGTFYYMSPEQVKGERSITHASDYYSVGSILFELLTGRILFHPASQAEIVYKTISVKPILPTSINAKVSNRIENVVLKLLEKDSFKRYRTSDEILENLNEKLEVKSTKAKENVKFYIRLIPNDSNVVEEFLKSHQLDGVDFPINLHNIKNCKTLKNVVNSKKDSMDFFADPCTNRLVYSNFKNTMSIASLPYAPNEFRPLDYSDFKDLAYLQSFAAKVIDLQVGNGCSVLTAPFFYFDNTKDEWYQINIKLLRESIDYAKKNFPQYKVSGGLCTNAEILCRKTEQDKIIEDFGNSDMDYLQFFVDKISETTNNVQLYNFIKTGLDIKKYNKKINLIACRVPSVALGLLTIGFHAITSGLAVIETFEKAFIIKEEGVGTMPTRFYFPDLLKTVSINGKTRTYEDILSLEEELKSKNPTQTISLACSCDGCKHTTMSENFKKPRLHFIHKRISEIEVMNNTPQGNRHKLFNERIDKAHKLQSDLIALGVKLDSPSYLLNWKEVLAKF